MLYLASMQSSEDDKEEKIETKDADDIF